MISLKEISSVYEALMTGGAVDTGPLPLQLRDYAAWQIKWLEERGEEIIRYWKEKFGRMAEEFDPAEVYREKRRRSRLPADVSGEKGMTRERFVELLDKSAAASYTTYSDLSICRQMIDLAKECEVTIWTVLIASVQLLFFLLEDRETALIAMLFPSRHLAGARSVIGCMVGGAYLRRRVYAEMSIKDFIREGYPDFLEAVTNLIYDHDQMGLGGPQLRMSTDVYINLLNREMMGDKKLTGSEVRGHQALDRPAYYSLSYTSREYENGLSHCWKYNSSLYSPERAALIAQQQETLLRIMCQAPDTRIGRLKAELLRS